MKGPQTFNTFGLCAKFPLTLSFGVALQQQRLCAFFQWSAFRSTRVGVSQ